MSKLGRRNSLSRGTEIRTEPKRKEESETDDEEVSRDPDMHDQGVIKVFLKLLFRIIIFVFLKRSLCCRDSMEKQDGSAVFPKVHFWK